MSPNYVFYQDVKMPNKEIGINVFYYECVHSPALCVFPLHWHTCMELIAVTSGWLDIEIDRQVCRVKAGEIAVINPSQLHACSSFDPSATLYCLMVDMDFFRSRFVESLDEQYVTPLLDGKARLVPHICGDEALNGLIADCCETFQRQQEAYQLRLKAILFQMLYQLCTQYMQCSSPDIQRGPSTLSRERVNVILHYVDEHYAERIKLDDLVEIVHINRYYICKIFQQYVGRTFLDYVNLVRIQKAVSLLVSTNKSITDIAFSTGFQDINYFSRIFKRIMGISPTELRKQKNAERMTDGSE